MNVHVEYRRANQVYEDVLSNVVDMGLVAYPVKDAKLEIIPLRKDPLVLICHPQHPFAKQKSIKLKALAGQKIIGFEPDIPTRKALDKILKEHGVDREHVMEFDNIETVKRAVEIDAGISIVPQGTVTQEVAKQTLAAVQIEDGAFFRPARRDLQEEQGALAGHEAVPRAAQRSGVRMAVELAAAERLRRLHFYFKFSGFSGFKSFGTKTPSLRISSPSNHTSPPPHSLRWISTMSQCTAERLPLSHSS